MTFYKILQKVGLPVEYGYIPDDTPAIPPFLIYLFDDLDTFKADNKIYSKHDNYRVEYYFKKKDLGIEAKIESVLDEHDIIYEKSGDTWIESEKLFVIYYYC